MQATPLDLYYQFVPTENLQQVVQLDYRKFSRASEFTDYVTFMADNAWYHVAGDKSSGTQYFIGASGQDQTLFSDTESLVARAKRTRDGAIMTVIPVFACWLVFINNHFDISYLFDPGKAFYTPGLAKSEGLALVAGVLWAIPSGLIRLMAHLGWVFGTFLVAVLIISAQLAFWRYKKKIL